jgi:3-oxoacyl-[acyl-carrier protein] reductase
VKPVAEQNGQARVAVVTGSSRGLGRAIAIALAATSTKVVVHYNQQGDAAQRVVDEIVRRAGSAVACQADLHAPDGCDQLFQQACDAFGQVDIIINNASPPVVRKPSLEATWADFECYFSLYVRSTFRLMQLAAPGMQARRFGRIVNVLCSLTQGVPSPRLAPYVTAKSALAGLSRALAVELGPFGITVNMVAPSLLVTDQSVALGDRARQLAASQAPMRRLADLAEVAEATRFLASDAAGFITGTILPVTGGEIM